MASKLKDCENCVHYRGKQYGLTLGSCEYPIPAWLRVGGGFVNGYEAHDCLLYEEKSAPSLSSEGTSALKSS